MSAIFPLGGFIQGRRAFNANGLMLGCGQVSAPNTTAKVSLNNNTQTGAYLAIYGVLGWSPSKPSLLVLYSKNQLSVPTGLVAQQMLVPGMPAIDGFVTAESGVFASDPSPIIIFTGSGQSWLTFGDCPIMVIPPGYACSVRQFVVQGQNVRGLPLTVSFCWGVYQTPKVPATFTPPTPIAQEPVQVTPTPPASGPATPL